jgi:23S rRNA (cytosine1962-C5)-methyltransferase
MLDIPPNQQASALTRDDHRRTMTADRKQQHPRRRARDERDTSRPRGRDTVPADAGPLTPARVPGSGGVPRLVLRPDRERSLQRRHPWIFSGAVERIEGTPSPGDTVEVRSAQGGFLAWAACSPDSQIVGRVWDFHEGARIGPEFFADRVRVAVSRRDRVFGAEPEQAVRLVHGEADGLPGVVVDRFADWAVELSTAGAWRWREAIVDAVCAATGISSVYERSDADVLALEGLSPQVGPLRGAAPVGPVRIEENGLHLSIDIVEGHKTGFYLDQRDNRALLRDLAAEREVLDCFCYTGGFTLSALAGGAAHVTSVDSSPEALAALRRHVVANKLPEARSELVQADVFAQLRKFRDQGRRFDVIVLDPPKFAPTASAAERAARGYKDINLWAMKLLRPGGLLFTFSCSGGVSRDLFQKIVAGAAVDAGVDARILHHMSAAADHPVTLTFPEGEYLKGLLCEIG